MKKAGGKLYLLPNYLSEKSEPGFIPEYNRKRIAHIRWFLIESHKSARFLLKDFPVDLKSESLQFDLVNEHTSRDEFDQIFLRIAQGEDVCLISDAGIPCVADPGAKLVSRLQEAGLAIIPLPGASSLFMALMASGFDGQQFSFHGYLSFDAAKRKAQIQDMERQAWKGVAQLFMETPYRNEKLLEQLHAICRKDTYLCIASHISSSEECIATKTLSEWKQSPPEIHKKPVLFILGKPAHIS